MRLKFIDNTPLLEEIENPEDDPDYGINIKLRGTSLEGIAKIIISKSYNGDEFKPLNDPRSSNEITLGNNDMVINISDECYLKVMYQPNLLSTGLIDNLIPDNHDDYEESFTLHFSEDSSDPDNEIDLSNNKIKWFEIDLEPEKYHHRGNVVHHHLTKPRLKFRGAKDFINDNLTEQSNNSKRRYIMYIVDPRCADTSNIDKFSNKAGNKKIPLCGKHKNCGEGHDIFSSNSSKCLKHYSPLPQEYFPTIIGYSGYEPEGMMKNQKLHFNNGSCNCEDKRFNLPFLVTYSVGSEFYTKRAVKYVKEGGIIKAPNHKSSNKDSMSIAFNVGDSISKEGVYVSEVKPVELTLGNAGFGTLSGISISLAISIGSLALTAAPETLGMSLVIGLVTFLAEAAVVIFEYLVATKTHHSRVLKVQIPHANSNKSIGRVIKHGQGGVGTELPYSIDVSKLLNNIKSLAAGSVPRNLTSINSLQSASNNTADMKGDVISVTNSQIVPITDGNPGTTKDSIKFFEAGHVKKIQSLGKVITFSTTKDLKSIVAVKRLAENGNNDQIGGDHDELHDEKVKYNILGDDDPNKYRELFYARRNPNCIVLSRTKHGNVSGIRFNEFKKGGKILGKNGSLSFIGEGDAGWFNPEYLNIVGRVSIYIEYGNIRRFLCPYSTLHTDEKQMPVFRTIHHSKGLYYNWFVTSDMRIIHESFTFAIGIDDDGNSEAEESNISKDSNKNFDIKPVVIRRNIDNASKLAKIDFNKSDLVKDRDKDINNGLSEISDNPVVSEYCIYSTKNIKSQDNLLDKKQGMINSILKPAGVCNGNDKCIYLAGYHPSKDKILEPSNVPGKPEGNLQLNNQFTIKMNYKAPSPKDRKIGAGAVVSRFQIRFSRRVDYKYDNNPCIQSRGSNCEDKHCIYLGVKKVENPKLKFGSKEDILNKRDVTTVFYSSISGYIFSEIDKNTFAYLYFDENDRKLKVTAHKPKITVNNGKLDFADKYKLSIGTMDEAFQELNTWIKGLGLKYHGGNDKIFRDLTLTFGNNCQPYISDALNIKNGKDKTSVGRIDIRFGYDTEIQFVKKGTSLDKISPEISVESSENDTNNHHKYQTPGTDINDSEYKATHKFRSSVKYMKDIVALGFINILDSSVGEFLTVGFDENGAAKGMKSAASVQPFEIIIDSNYRFKIGNCSYGLVYDESKDEFFISSKSADEFKWDAQNNRLSIVQGSTEIINQNSENVSGNGEKYIYLDSDSKLKTTSSKDKADVIEISHKSKLYQRSVKLKISGEKDKYITFNNKGHIDATDNKEQESILEFTESMELKYLSNGNNDINGDQFVSLESGTLSLTTQDDGKFYNITQVSIDNQGPKIQDAGLESKLESKDKVTPRLLVAHKSGSGWKYKNVVYSNGKIKLKDSLKDSDKPIFAENFYKRLMPVVTDYRFDEYHLFTDNNNLTIYNQQSILPFITKHYISERSEFIYKLPGTHLYLSALNKDKSLVGFRAFDNNPAGAFNVDKVQVSANDGSNGKTNYSFIEFMNKGIGYIDNDGTVRLNQDAPDVKKKISTEHDIAELQNITSMDFHNPPDMPIQIIIKDQKGNDKTFEYPQQSLNTDESTKEVRSPKGVKLTKDNISRKFIHKSEGFVMTTDENYALKLNDNLQGNFQSPDSYAVVGKLEWVGKDSIDRREIEKFVFESSLDGSIVMPALENTTYRISYSGRKVYIVRKINQENLDTERIINPSEITENSDLINQASSDDSLVNDQQSSKINIHLPKFATLYHVLRWKMTVPVKPRRKVKLTKDSGLKVNALNSAEELVMMMTYENGLVTADNRYIGAKSGDNHLGVYESKPEFYKVDISNGYLIFKDEDNNKIIPYLDGVSIKVGNNPPKSNSKFSISIMNGRNISFQYDNYYPTIDDSNKLKGYKETHYEATIPTNIDFFYQDTNGMLRTSTKDHYLVDKGDKICIVDSSEISKIKYEDKVFEVVQPSECIVKPFDNKRKLYYDSNNDVWKFTNNGAGKIFKVPPYRFRVKIKNSGKGICVYGYKIHVCENPDYFRVFVQEPDGRIRSEGTNYYLTFTQLTSDNNPILSVYNDQDYNQIFDWVWKTQSLKIKKFGKYLTYDGSFKWKNNNDNSLVIEEVNEEAMFLMHQNQYIVPKGDQSTDSSKIQPDNNDLYNIFKETIESELTLAQNVTGENIWIRDNIGRIYNTNGQYITLEWEENDPKIKLRSKSENLYNQILEFHYPYFNLVFSESIMKFALKVDNSTAIHVGNGLEQETHITYQSQPGIKVEELRSKTHGSLESGFKSKSKNGCFRFHYRNPKTLLAMIGKLHKTMGEYFDIFEKHNQHEIKSEKSENIQPLLFIRNHNLEYEVVGECHLGFNRSTELERSHKQSIKLDRDEGIADDDDKILKTNQSKGNSNSPKFGLSKVQITKKNKNEILTLRPLTGNYNYYIDDKTDKPVKVTDNGIQKPERYEPTLPFYMNLVSISIDGKYLTNDLKKINKNKFTKIGKFGLFNVNYRNRDGDKVNQYYICKLPYTGKWIQVKHSSIDYSDKINRLKFKNNNKLISTDGNCPEIDNVQIKDIKSQRFLINSGHIEIDNVDGNYLIKFPSESVDGGYLTNSNYHELIYHSNGMIQVSGTDLYCSNERDFKNRMILKPRSSLDIRSIMIIEKESVIKTLDNNYCWSRGDVTFGHDGSTNEYLKLKDVSQDTTIESDGIKETGNNINITLPDEEDYWIALTDNIDDVQTSDYLTVHNEGHSVHTLKLIQNCLTRFRYDENGNIRTSDKEGNNIKLNWNGSWKELTFNSEGSFIDNFGHGIGFPLVQDTQLGRANAYYLEGRIISLYSNEAKSTNVYGHDGKIKYPFLSKVKSQIIDIRTGNNNQITFVDGSLKATQEYVPAIFHYDKDSSIWFKHYNGDLVKKFICVGSGGDLSVTFSENSGSKFLIIPRIVGEKEFLTIQVRDTDKYLYTDDDSTIKVCKWKDVGNSVDADKLEFDILTDFQPFYLTNSITQDVHLARKSLDSTTHQSQEDLFFNNHPGKKIKLEYRFPKDVTNTNVDKGSYYIKESDTDKYLKRSDSDDIILTDYDISNDPKYLFEMITVGKRVTDYLLMNDGKYLCINLNDLDEDDYLHCKNNLSISLTKDSTHISHLSVVAEPIERALLHYDGNDETDIKAINFKNKYNHGLSSIQSKNNYGEDKDFDTKKVYTTVTVNSNIQKFNSNKIPSMVTGAKNSCLKQITSDTNDLKILNNHDGKSKAIDNFGDKYELLVKNFNSKKHLRAVDPESQTVKIKNQSSSTNVSPTLNVPPILKNIDFNAYDNDTDDDGNKDKVFVYCIYYKSIRPPRYYVARFRIKTQIAKSKIKDSLPEKITVHNSEGYRLQKSSNYDIVISNYKNPSNPSNIVQYPSGNVIIKTKHDSVKLLLISPKNDDLINVMKISSDKLKKIMAFSKKEDRLMENFYDASQSTPNSIMFLNGSEIVGIESDSDGSTDLNIQSIHVLGIKGSGKKSKYEHKLKMVNNHHLN